MHHLNEHTRRAYLEAMGVTQWYARYLVANGKSLAWPELEGKASDDAVQAGELTSGADILARAGFETEAEQPKRAPVPSPASTAIVSARNKSSETPEPVATPDSSTASTKIAADSSASASMRQSAGVEFIQRWWARGPWCIVDTRAKNMPQAQQKAADRLMAALAQVVCGQRTPEVAHHIDWPLFVNRSIPHDVNEARFYLSQKWDAVQQQAPTRRLILLGEQTPELLGHELDQVQSSSWTTDSGLFCLLGPGTSELMHLPGRKREFWQQLQQWLPEDRS